MSYDENVTPAAEKPRKKNVFLIAICAAVVALIAIGCGLFFLLRYNGNQNNGLYVISIYEDEQHTIYPIYNKQLISEPIHIGNKHTASQYYNADKSAYFKLYTDGSLYLFTPTRAELFMNNVESARFSQDGKALYLLCDGVDNGSYSLAPYTLKRYDIASDSYKTIATDVASMIREYGSGAVYLTTSKDGIRQLRVVDDTQNRTILETKSSYILAVNDDLSKIYIQENISYGKNEYVCYDEKGNRTLLYSCNNEQYHTEFNRDYTQMLIVSFGSEGSYICEIGKEAVKISDGWVELVEPFHDTNASYPIVDDFYGQFYRANRDGEPFTYEGWIIHRDLSQSVQVTPSASFLSMDPSGEFVYYLDGHRLYGGDFRIAKISDMADAHKNSVLLTNDTADFDDDGINFEINITSDGSIVYYTSGDNVYSIDGYKGGTPKLIASGIDHNSFRLSFDDVMYYQMDSDLYAYDGKTSQLVMEDAEIVAIGDFPYATKDGKFYYLAKGKAPAYLFDLI